MSILTEQVDWQPVAWVTPDGYRKEVSSMAGGASFIVTSPDNGAMFVSPDAGELDTCVTKHREQG